MGLYASAAVRLAQSDVWAARPPFGPLPYTPQAAGEAATAVLDSVMGTLQEEVGSMQVRQRGGGC